MAQADDGGALRRKRCVVVFGGGVYLFIFPHTRPSLYLDNDKKLGLFNPLKKGKVDGDGFEGGGRCHLLHNFNTPYCCQFVSLLLSIFCVIVRVLDTHQN